MPPPPPTQDADPSMEEILASIRRILNEDTVTEAATPADPDDGVLVLDKSMIRDPAAPVEAAPSLAPPPAPPLASPAEPEAPAVDPAQMAADAILNGDSPPLAEPPATESKVSTAPDLVAPEAAAAAATAMGNLMRTLAADRRPKVWSEGPTLEDLVRVTLRPLLKEWLDANLPPIVERLVRTEIERVVGRVIP